MSNQMKEFSPQPRLEHVIEGSSAKTVSDRAKGLVKDKIRTVTKMAPLRKALVGAATSLIIASGCGNAESDGVKVTINRSSDDVTVKIIPAEPTPTFSSGEVYREDIVPYAGFSPNSEDPTTSEQKVETAEERIAREKAESLFPGIHFKSLRVEAEAIESKFSKEDGIRKERPAQGYFFEAYKGQRLTTLAENVEEGRTADLESELFNENGEPILAYESTRLEFVAPETGRYYVIVRNDDKDETSYKMSLKDRDKSSIVIKIRGADGKEYFLSEGDKIPEVSFLDFGFMVHTNKAVDPTTITPYIYALPGTWEQFQQKAFFPEDNEGNMIPAKYTHLDNGVIFVEPENGPFPDNSQIVIGFSTGSNSGYIQRFFTVSQAAK